MTTAAALRFPLAQAFALQAARTIRDGRKLPGMSYADRELAEAIEAAAAAKQTVGTAVPAVR